MACEIDQIDEVAYRASISRSGLLHLICCRSAGSRLELLSLSTEDIAMKAARINAYGVDPTVEDVAAPEVGPNDVLVRIAAAALNPLDVKLSDGSMTSFFPLTFPYTIGTDLAGTLERVGSNVAGWSAGDRVLARTDPSAGSAIAEYAAVPASDLARVPMAVPLEVAAGLPTAAGAAWQALFEVGDLKPGQTAFIHAGAGGVGSFAVQFAHAAGARVIATASGDAVVTVRRLGADQVIDYKAEDFASAASDVDLVLDTVGGDTQQRSFQLLRAGGTLLSVVQPPDESVAKAHDVAAAFVFHRSNADRLSMLLERVAAGAQVLVDRVLPLDELPSAFAHQASGRARGKVIVTIMAGR